jgi:hypothetical protein
VANSLLYGFYQLKDVANSRAIEYADALNAAIVMTLAEHNAQVNDLLGLFAEPTTDYQRRFVAASNNRLQAGDENSRANPVKGSTYDVQFPIQKGDTAWGENFITRRKMTVQQVNNAISQMLKGDITWLRDHVLAALFYNSTGWTIVDPEWGTLTIQGLANGDSTLYAKIGAVAAADTHQLAQAAAIADATNPFSTAYAELMEHPENQGSEIVSLISSSLTATATALTPFVDVSDPNVIRGSGTDAVVGTPSGLPSSATLLGRTNNVWVAEWGWLPTDYMVTLAVGAEKPLKMRQDPEPDLQGFVKADTRTDYPFSEEQYFRRAGFGAWNRVGAVVTRIGNGTYAIPTNFGSPMY